MIIVVKIILVAFAVFGQAKLFPEHAAPAEGGLDSLVLPVEKPELALAYRAMAAEGLCKASEKTSAAKASLSGGDAQAGIAAIAVDSAAVPSPGKDPKHDLATNCF